MKNSLIYVINHFSAGAVPNILFDIIPYIKRKYEVKIIVLQKINNNDALISKFHSLNVPVESLNLSKYQFIKSFFDLKKYFNQNKPDIIHSNLGRADFFSALTKTKNSKLLSTRHSVKENYNFFTKIGYKFIDKKVDILTAVSNTVEKSWSSDTISKRDWCTVYNPVNIQEISKTKSDRSILEDMGILPKHEIIINVGNLKKQKGQIFLIRAFKKVLDTRKDARLIIVGKKSDAWLEIESEINKLQLQDKVIVTGFREDIAEILKISDVFVFPSLTEGLGIAVLEAMAAKVPVIASDLPAIKEYIENEREGFLVEANDPEKIAVAIIQVLSEQKLKEIFTINAYKKVNKLFNPEEIANKYLELYDSLIK